MKKQRTFVRGIAELSGKYRGSLWSGDPSQRNVLSRGSPLIPERNTPVFKFSPEMEKRRRQVQAELDA